jgi:hypothetical protein
MKTKKNKIKKLTQADIAKSIRKVAMPSPKVERTEKDKMRNKRNKSCRDLLDLGDLCG